MTPLHEELYNKLSVANPYTPNTHLFQFFEWFNRRENCKFNSIICQLDVHNLIML